MVQWYADLEHKLPQSTRDALPLIIAGSIVSLPLLFALAWGNQSKLLFTVAMIVASSLAILQVMAVVENVRKYPL